jgi:hypothetical protein
VLDPPVYVESPPTYVPPPQQQQTSYSGGGTKHRRKHQKASIYGVQSKLHRGPNGSFTLYITFRVRRPVTIGVEALHRGRVVGSSGLKRFRGKRGELTIQLDPRRWPTGLRFVTPRKGGA